MSFLTQSWLPSWGACVISFTDASIADSLCECNSVVYKPINELRCSLRNPRKFSSVCRNKHLPRHFVFPFTNDQHMSLLFFIFPFHPRIHSPSKHATSPSKSWLSIRSPIRRTHHVPSHKTCTMICEVDVWSCVLCVRFQSIVLDHEHFCSTHVRRQIRSLLVLRVFVVRLIVQSYHSYQFSRTTHCHTRIDIQSSHHLVASRFRLAWICLPRSLLLSSKNDLSRSNVICFLFSLPSAAWSVTSTFMDLCLMDAVISDDTFTNQSSTNTLSSFLSIYFYIFFLFIMNISFFPMNKTFPTWKMWCIDTRGLLTSAITYRCLQNPEEFWRLWPAIHCSWSASLRIFEPFTIIGSFRFVCGYLRKHTLRHHVATECTATVTFFHVHCAPPAFRLVFFVVFCQVGVLISNPLASPFWWVGSFWINMILPHHQISL